LAAGEFKRLRDPHHFADTFEKFKVAMIEIAVNADRAEDSVRSTGGAVYVEAAGDDSVDHVLNLLFSGAFVHDDNHG
jgi:hypothetical protein